MTTLTDTEKQSIRDAFDAVKALPGYVYRHAQSQMIGAVARALTTPKGVLVTQAPTGTGKSLAYLVAGAPLAVARERTLVLSTATVTLQEQLMRDVPKFIKLAGLDIKVALAKGRGRYACVRELHALAAKEDNTLSGFDLEPAWPRPPRAGEADVVELLMDALESEQWAGDLDNAPVTIPDGLKPLLTTTSAGCSGRKCPLAPRCGFMHARREIEGAAVVIANHDIVLADLTLQQETMGEAWLISPPGNAFYVFDEGHHLPNKAVDVGVFELHFDRVDAALSKARRVLRLAMRALDVEEVQGLTATQHGERMLETSTALRGLGDNLVQSWLERQQNDEPIWRFVRGVLPNQLVDAIAPIAADLQSVYSVLANMTDRLRKATDQTPLVQRALRDVAPLTARLKSPAQLLEDWANPAIGCRARWLFKEEGEVSLHSSPTAAGDLLRELLWDKADGVVATSATLTASDGDFTHFAESVGLPESAECLALASPFDLERQGALIIPAMPTDPNDPGHPAASAQWLEANWMEQDGALMIFTSWRKMQATYDALPAALQAQVLVQGELPKAKLLEEHRARVDAGQHSLLMGLQSLGEGVDLPGAYCRRVLIAQLPFSPPTDPVGATLSEFYDDAGRSPFHELTLPEAIRTLNQWCGRLIRTENDTGEVVILDRRLRTKGYGRKVVAALPPFARC